MAAQIEERSDPLLEQIRKQKAVFAAKLHEVEALEREQLGANGMGSPWLELGAILEARRSVSHRHSTGLPSLDAKIEGGLYAGTLTVVQGKPGIGKTMLGTQIALELGKRCAVGALYADEGITGAAVRIGQQLGIPRADLMAGRCLEQAQLALDGTRPFFRFLDPSREESTVEFLFKDFDATAPAGLQRVILLDSAQVVRSEKVSPRQDVRQAVSTLLKQTRAMALRYRAIAIVISQVNRASYRSKNEEDRVDPLAAGLESSGIEFMAELILHLDGKPTPADPAVTLRAPKNRMSAEGTFDLPLMMDFPRARFLEADVPSLTAEENLARDAKWLQAVSRAKERVLKELKKNPTGLSKTALRELVPARPAIVSAAVDELYQRSEIFPETTGRRGGGTIWAIPVPGLNVLVK